MNLGFGVDFDYHRHGPFSSELAFATDDARALGLVEADERYGYHAVPYSVFRATTASGEPAHPHANEARRRALAIMRRYPAEVLELAATAVYLREHGYPKTFWDEVRVRKPLKATDARMTQAEALVRELKL